jgi:hypothetical protein
VRAFEILDSVTSFVAKEVTGFRSAADVAAVAGYLIRVLIGIPGFQLSHVVWVDWTEHGNPTTLSSVLAKAGWNNPGLLAINPELNRPVHIRQACREVGQRTMILAKIYPEPAKGGDDHRQYKKPVGVHDR